MHGLVDRHGICLRIRPHRSSKSCWSLRWNCARAAAKSSMDISKSRSRTRSMKSWMNWKSCRRWRRIMPSGMVCATRWRATIKTDPGSIIRSPSKKNSVAIKNAIIQEAERLRQQMEQTQTATEQDSSQDEEPSAEKTSTDASTNPTLADENTSSTAFLSCAASIRISSEFNHPPVSPDGTDLPRQCRAAQQSNGHPHRLQAPQKAHAEAAGDGA